MVDAATPEPRFTSPRPRYTVRWEAGAATISDNVPDAFTVANQRDENGYFSNRALTRGNPIDRQYDINFNIGGSELTAILAEGSYQTPLALAREVATKMTAVITQ